MVRNGGRAVQLRLKLQYLRVIAKLDETQSVTKAAEHLHVTRAALSKTLAAIEEMLGVQLYVRTATGMAPTPYGMALARHARIILGNITSAEDEIIDLLNEERERVTIGAFFVAMPVLIPQAIAALQASHPRCLFAVREGDMFELIAGLQDGKLDIVVGRVHPRYFRDDVATLALYEERLLAVCRHDHPLADVEHLTWRKAAEYPWVLPPKESPVRSALQTQFAAEGVSGPKIVIEALSIPLTLGLLETASAIGLMPQRVALHAQQRNAIAVLRLELPPLPAPMGIAWLRDRPLAPLAQALVSALKTGSEAPGDHPGYPVSQN
ncbi:MAG TPA: LysR family transcriptional regulator [Burkholderiaceae bacterium]|nr:LysR family transcriptional regulator [Burkholderiaceae bacterium]